MNTRVFNKVATSWQGVLQIGSKLSYILYWL